MIEMMFLEHVFLVIVFSFLVGAAFAFGAVMAQFIDIDHVLNYNPEASFSEKFNRALDSIPYMTSDGYFQHGSMGLHRGVLHRPVIFYSAVLLVVVATGFVFGWFFHLVSDGIGLMPWGGF